MQANSGPKAGQNQANSLSFFCFLEMISFNYTAFHFGTDGNFGTIEDRKLYNLQLIQYSLFTRKPDIFQELRCISWASRGLLKNISNTEMQRILR
jgi:hypothetical protein